MGFGRLKTPLIPSRRASAVSRDASPPGKPLRIQPNRIGSRAFGGNAAEFPLYSEIGENFGARAVIVSAVASRGRTTLPKSVRQALGLVPGDRVRYVILDNGEVRLIPARPLSRLFGALRHGGPPVPLRDMDRAVAEGANDR